MLRRHIYVCIYGLIRTCMYVCLHICKLAGVIKCNVLDAYIYVYPLATENRPLMREWVWRMGKDVRMCGYHQSQRIKILLCHIPQTSGEEGYLLAVRVFYGLPM